jgi:t-SNARE complex subunit (syntaxin)
VTALNDRIAGLQNELGRAQGQLDAVQRERLTTRTVLQIIVGVVIMALVIIVAVVVLLSLSL